MVSIDSIMFISDRTQNPVISCVEASKEFDLNYLLKPYSRSHKANSYLIEK